MRAFTSGVVSAPHRLSATQGPLSSAPSRNSAHLVIRAERPDLTGIEMAGLDVKAFLTHVPVNGNGEKRVLENTSGGDLPVNKV